MPGWYIASDNQVIIDKLTDKLTGNVLDDATITGQMYDSSDVAVGDAITFEAQAGACGKYVGVIPESLDLVEGDVYDLLITITTATDFTHTQRIRRMAEYDER